MERKFGAHGITIGSAEKKRWSAKDYFKTALYIAAGTGLGIAVLKVMATETFCRTFLEGIRQCISF